nr:MAG TPA: hypothetical protein [Bacteriophage sp.]DAY34911.1 MAG TPA: hypothetical protein [Bacteriophage sp.]
MTSTESSQRATRLLHVRMCSNMFKLDIPSAYIYIYSLYIFILR